MYLEELKRRVLASLQIVEEKEKGFDTQKYLLKITTL